MGFAGLHKILHPNTSLKFPLSRKLHILNSPLLLIYFVVVVVVCVCVNVCGLHMRKCAYTGRGQRSISDVVP